MELSDLILTADFFTGLKGKLTDLFLVLIWSGLFEYGYYDLLDRGFIKSNLVIDDNAT